MKWLMAARHSRDLLVSAQPAESAPLGRSLGWRVRSRTRAGICAVIEAESGGDPRAISSAGAVGVMQLMPDTAAVFRVRNRFDVEDNVRAGVAYLAWLRDLCGGDRRLIAASYIAGQNRVLRLGLNFAYSKTFTTTSRASRTCIVETVGKTLLHEKEWRQDETCYFLRWYGAGLGADADQTGREPTNRE